MIKTIEAKMLKQSANAVKYVKVKGLKDAQGSMKEINRQVDKDFGLVGPLSLSTPSERVHAVRWVTAREAFVVETNVKRAIKETVATVTAQINKCPYCEDVHGASISSSGDNDIAKALANNTWQSLKNKRTKAIIEWSLNTRNPKAEIIQNPPFSAQEAPEIIGTALTFHSVNRLVNIFLDDSPLPGILGKSFIKKAALNMASKTLFKSMVIKKAVPGDALEFIEDYPIPEHFSWANAVPAYVKGLAAEEKLLEKIEQEIIPIKSAQLFKEKVNSWNGEEMPLGRAWLNQILSDLDENERPVTKLMFLAALAPYTITETDIKDFRKVKPTDKDLLEVSYWAVQILTNRIREWLVMPFTNKN